MELSRRQMLRAGLAASALGISGCSSDSNDQSTGTGGASTPTQTATATSTQSQSQQQQNRACGPAVDVSGSITQDTTWDCRYRMTDDVTVTNGATLFVTGALVEAEQDTILSVEDGTLVTDGTQQEPPEFRSVEGDPGSWKGIEITADSTDSSLRNAVVRDGGASGWANVYVQNGAAVSFNGCLFDRSATYGIDAEENTTLQRFRNCSFRDNQTRAMRVPATVLGSLDTATAYDNTTEPGGVDVRNETVTSDTIWLDIGENYYFPSGVAIEAEVVIREGADLRFGQDTRFSVETGGLLRAEGSSGSQVTFTGEQTNTPGYWHGIEIVSDNRNNLSYATVVDGGGDGWANVYVQNGGRVSIDNCTLRASETYGLHAEANTTLESFTGNDVWAGGTGSMYIPLANLDDIDADTTFTGSGDQTRVEVTAETVPRQTTWPALDTTVHFTESCSIDAPVTVDPGASFTFAQGSLLSVEQGGSLNAVGTANDPITFEGETDVSGFWGGIEVVSLEPDNVFDHCEIANGGSGGWANVYIQDSGMATVRNSTLRDSSTYAIYVEDGGRLTRSNNTFSGNASGQVSP